MSQEEFINAYPDIAIISDGPPERNTGGISQTLFNIFESYPGKIYLIDNEWPKDQTGKEYLKGSQISVKTSILPKFRNRFGAFFSAYIQFINLSYLNIFFKKIKIPSDTVILVSTTNIDKLLLAYLLQKKGNYKLITYFMDDWAAGQSVYWLGGNIQVLMKKILNNSFSWMMISENLHSTFLARYELQNKPCLIVHNPVDEPENINNLDVSSENEEKTIIAYAGSIWPMHFDALLKIAQSLELVNQMNYLHKVELHVYCPEAHWLVYEKKLSLPFVTYKGFVKYENLKTALLPAQFLLATASFLKEFEPYSFSSVQTKLTDYMRLGKPIICIGPRKAAINLFVKQWNCGFVIENDNPELIAKQLCEYIQNSDEQFTKAFNGAMAVKEHFSKNKVQQKTYRFIADSSSKLYA